MEELTHSLLENGSIQRSGDQFILSKKPSDLQVPDTIQGIIAARMDRLEENLKRIMQVASVIGREFAFRILQAISDLREDLKSELLNLQGLELIYEKSLFPELEYVFKHALTQEVAYNSLLSNRRKEIHKRIGSAIEEIYAGNLEEFYEVLAYHYSKSEEIEKGGQYLKLSRGKAVRNHALWEAYGFYKEAVNFLSRPPEINEKKKEIIDIILLMRPPMALLGYPEGSFGFLMQGEGLAKEMGDTRRLALIHSLLGNYYTQTGDYLTAIRYTEEGFEETLKAQDIDLMVPLGVSLCVTYYSLGQYKKIIDKMPEVIHLIEKKGRESEFFTVSLNPYSFICSYCGDALGVLGRFEEGKAFMEKALSNALLTGDPATLGITQVFYGLLYYSKGDFTSAKEHFEEGIVYCEEAKFTWGAAMALCFLGHVHSFLGDPETGRKKAEKGLHIWAETGVVQTISIAHYTMGEIGLALNDLENAKTVMEEALSLSRKNGEKAVEGLALVGLGRVLGKKEPRRIEKAEECFSQGLAILQDQELKPFYSPGRMYLGEFCLDGGEKEKALENLKEAEGMFQEMGMEYYLERTREILGKL